MRRPPRPLSVAVAGLTLVAAGALPALASTVPADTTAPVVVAAVAAGAPAGNNGWYLGPVTMTVTATDTGTVASREYSLDGGATWTAVGEDGTVTIAREGAGAVQYRATDAAGNVSAVGTVAVNIDSRTPVVDFPQAVAGRVGSSVVLKPVLSDQLPGSGDGSRDGLNNPGVLDMRLDGRDVKLHPVDLSTLALGRHTLTVDVNDPAGNAARYTLTFVVTAGFEDLDALVTRYETAGTVPAATVTSLRSTLADARASVDAGKTAQAGRQLRAVRALARTVPDKAVRDVLSRSADGLLTTTLDGAPSTEGTGLTSVRIDGPKALPTVTPTTQADRDGAAFDVLVVSRTGGFRHNHIPDSVVAIQEMGRDNGFGVDVFDPALTQATLATNPLMSLEALQEYETIVFDSNTGNSSFSDAEKAAIESYVRSGGGVVGIHASTDSSREWQWYRDLMGAVFIGHPQGPLSLNPPCETCIDGADVLTEDPTHPATAHLPRRWVVKDELYNLDHNVRGEVHTLQSLDEGSYRDNLNIIRTGRFANGFNTLMGDHPITWCQNYDGARVYTQVLGHNRELWYDQSYLTTIEQGILYAAGITDANCSSYREAERLMADLTEQGDITPAAAEVLGGHLATAKDAYLRHDEAGALTALRTLNSTLRSQITTTPARDEVRALTTDLISWMATARTSGGSGQPVVPAVATR